MAEHHKNWTTVQLTGYVAIVSDRHVICSEITDVQVHGLPMVWPR
jgi:hypothetical protein